MENWRCKFKTFKLWLQNCLCFCRVNEIFPKNKVKFKKKKEKKKKEALDSSTVSRESSDKFSLS
jgi:hypothetical protein